MLFDFIFSMVQSDLFLSVLEYNLKEIAYAADVAQLGYVLMCIYILVSIYRGEFWVVYRIGFCLDWIL